MLHSNNAYTEWLEEKRREDLHKESPRSRDARRYKSMMDIELERERQRLSNALSAIPQMLVQDKAPTVAEFANKAELSMAEVLLDNWDQVLQLVVVNEKLKGEVSKLLHQIEQMSTAIYSAVESAIRPMRDTRINDASPSDDF
jgi:hypothetical protein